MSGCNALTHVSITPPLMTRKEKDASPAGAESAAYQALAHEFQEMVQEVVQTVQETPKKVSHFMADHQEGLDRDDASDPHVVSRNKAKHFVVAVQQVKEGIEHVMR